MLNINEKMYKPKIKMNENDDTIKKKKKKLYGTCEESWLLLMASVYSDQLTQK